MQKLQLDYRPKITNRTYDDEHSKIKFTMEGLPLCFANGLRRCMISHIPTVMFYVKPEKKEKWVNGSRFHNEVIEERLMSIPVHTKDLQTLPGKYMLEINANNETDHVLNVTTDAQFFKIRNKETGQYLDDAEVRTLLPPNPKTGMYIDFLRLNAKIGNLPTARLVLDAEFAVATGGQDSKAVSAFIGMSNTVDRLSADQAWTEKEIELRTAKNGAEPPMQEEMELAKKNFFALDVQRIFKPDCYDFCMQTVGVYTCDEICKMAAEALERLLAEWTQALDVGEVQIVPTKSTMEHSWTVKIGGDCYTVGPILEWIMYVLHYLPAEMGGKSKQPLLNFCSFRKSHPHDDEANLTLAFTEETDKGVVGELLAGAAGEARRIVGELGALF